jgi:hypothetical protein
MNYGDFLEYVDSFLNKPELTARIPYFVKTARLRLQRRYNFAFTITEGSGTYPGVADTGIVLPSAFKALAGEFSVAVAGTRIEGTDLNSLRGRTIRGSTSTTQYYYLKTTTSGSKLFITPEPLSQAVTYDYYAWLADYADSSEEDYFLKYGFDVLLWETLLVANLWLADENRVPINAKAFEIALNEFQAVESQKGLSGSPIEAS